MVPLPAGLVGLSNAKYVCGSFLFLLPSQALPKAIPLTITLTDAELLEFQVRWLSVAYSRFCRETVIAPPAVILQEPAAVTSTMKRKAWIDKEYKELSKKLLSLLRTAGLSAAEIENMPLKVWPPSCGCGCSEILNNMLRRSGTSTA